MIKLLLRNAYRIFIISQMLMIQKTYIHQQISCYHLRGDRRGEAGRGSWNLKILISGVIIFCFRKHCVLFLWNWTICYPLTCKIWKASASWGHDHKYEAVLWTLEKSRKTIFCYKMINFSLRELKFSGNMYFSYTERLA